MFYDIRRGWIIFFLAIQTWKLLLENPIDYCYSFSGEDFAYENGYDSRFDYYYEFFDLLSIDSDNVWYSYIAKTLFEVERELLVLSKELKEITTP
jgi:hypothetical protein